MKWVDWFNRSRLDSRVIDSGTWDDGAASLFS